MATMSDSVVAIRFGYVGAGPLQDFDPVAIGIADEEAIGSGYLHSLLDSHAERMQVRTDCLRIR